MRCAQAGARAARRQRGAARARRQRRGQRRHAQRARRHAHPRQRAPGEEAAARHRQVSTYHCTLLLLCKQK